MKVVYFDFTVDNNREGRILVELLKDSEIPSVALHNFLELCTTKAPKPQFKRGKRVDETLVISYWHTQIHRIVKDFIIQGGDLYWKKGKGGHSVYDTEVFILEEEYSCEPLLDRFQPEDILLYLTPTTCLTPKPPATTEPNVEDEEDDFSDDEDENEKSKKKKQKEEIEEEPTEDMDPAYYSQFFFMPRKHAPPEHSILLGKVILNKSFIQSLYNMLTLCKPDRPLDFPVHYINICQSGLVPEDDLSNLKEFWETKLEAPLPYPMYPEDWDPTDYDMQQLTFDSSLQIAYKIYDLANSFFKKGFYYQAIQNYEKSMRYIHYFPTVFSPNPEDHDLNPITSEWLVLYMKLHLNLSLSHLKVTKWAMVRSYVQPFVAPLHPFCRWLLFTFEIPEDKFPFDDHIAEDMYKRDTLPESWVSKEIKTELKSSIVNLWSKALYRFALCLENERYYDQCIKVLDFTIKLCQNNDSLIDEAIYDKFSSLSQILKDKKDFQYTQYKKLWTPGN